MKKIQVLILLSFFYSADVSAQGIHYGGMQQFQFNFGQSGSNGALTVINGIRFGRFFTGIGAVAQFSRINSYYYGGWGYNVGSNSALFVDGRYYINKSKTFFVKLNGGANFLYGSNENNDYQKIDRGIGLYSAYGLGFKVRLGKEVFYSFDVSYSTRQSRYNLSYHNFVNDQWSTEKYNIQRYFITVNMGIELF